MDRCLYIAMNGAKQTLVSQTSSANNLANMQTSGFKADFEQFRSMPVFGPGFPTRVYAMSERPASDFTDGPMQTTDNPYNVAVNGAGWLAVRDPKGQEAYTRAGELKVTTTGQLLTGDGLPIIGNNGPVVLPPFDQLVIGKDGTINIVPTGGNPTTVVAIDRFKLVNPPIKNIEKLDDGLMHLKPPSPGQPPNPPLQADPNVELVQGGLEGSNVSSASAMVEMVSMIELARNFELQTKVMKTANEDSGVSAKLMQMA